MSRGGIVPEIERLRWVEEQRRIWDEICDGLEQLKQMVKEGSMDQKMKDDLDRHITGGADPYPPGGAAAEELQPMREMTVDEIRIDELRLLLAWLNSAAPETYQGLLDHINMRIEGLDPVGKAMDQINAVITDGYGKLSFQQLRQFKHQLQQRLDRWQIP